MNMGQTVKRAEMSVIFLWNTKTPKSEEIKQR